MQPQRLREQSVYTTPWFSLVERRPLDEPEAPPHYSLVTHDYVCVVALTRERQFILVRQFRPAVEQMTLELPAGTVDAGEHPEACVRRELEEETGFQAGAITHLGTLQPDTGRLSNRMWCYLAEDVRRVGRSIEPGIETLLLSPSELGRAIATSQLDHALHLAAIFLGVFQNRIQLSWPADCSVPGMGS